MTETGTAPSRSSGLLLHVTSLPGRFGIGDLGVGARAFIDQLAGAGQRYWQLLPVGPTGYGNSPYSASSTFAGNPLLISPDLLALTGLLTREEIEQEARPGTERVDYKTVTAAKGRLLAQATDEFDARSGAEIRDRFAEFREVSGVRWLHEYCLFAALKQVHGDRSWTVWPHDLAKRDPAQLSKARRELDDVVHRKEIEQFLFFDQWRSLRDEAKRKGVELVGDLPLYVAHDSADVWVNQDLFMLDEEGEPTFVAGVPPDYFSTTGQRWGNPIYDWDEMTRRGFGWWRQRCGHALALFDLLRIDHFRGLAGYWAIPSGESTAVKGEWRPAPGLQLLRAVKDDLDGLPILAEDLGVITDDVVSLRQQFGLPGMRVAQFGFDNAPDTALHHPRNYPENVWAYTGTHDNNTTEGWFWQDNDSHRVWRLPRPRRNLYRRVAGRVSWGLLEMVAESKARTAVFPVQDVLGLGSSARMNTPGTVAGNWEWRLQEEQLTEEALGQLLGLTSRTGRSP